MPFAVSGSRLLEQSRSGQEGGFGRLPIGAEQSRPTSDLHGRDPFSAEGQEYVHDCRQVGQFKLSFIS